MRHLTFNILMAMAILCAAFPAQAKEKAVAVFTVNPQMHCQNCENKIKGNLRFEKGVSEITTDLEQQTVKVDYDTDKTDVAKLQAAFNKIGYEATEVTSTCVTEESCAGQGNTPDCVKKKSCTRYKGCGDNVTAKGACCKKD